MLRHPAPGLSLPLGYGIEVVDDAGLGQQEIDHLIEAFPVQRASLAAPVQPLEEIVHGNVAVTCHAPAVAAQNAAKPILHQSILEAGDSQRPSPLGM